jgi:hypothetical protein
MRLIRHYIILVWGVPRPGLVARTVGAKERRALHFLCAKPAAA